MVRWAAKQFFLTYSRCPLARDVILAIILTVGAVAGAVIVQETHEDGGFHLHALVEYVTKRNVKNERAFDVKGPDGTIYHPNVEKVRQVLKAKKYLAKEDETPLLYGNTDAWSTRETRDYVSELRELDPDERINYTIKHKIQKWQYDAICSKRDDITITDEPTTGTIHDPAFFNLRMYVQENKSLVLCGNTGAGKTTAAKQCGPYPMLWVTHIDDLKHFVSGYHVSILFDDLSFVHLPRSTQLFLLDVFETRSIHIRYACATIPAGVMRIFTCNFEQFPFLTGDTALRRRYVLVEGDPDFNVDDIVVDTPLNMSIVSESDVDMADE